MPFTTTTVIPPGWADAHRSLAEATHTSTVRITRRDEGETPGTATAKRWDPQHGKAAPTPRTTVYEGPARLAATTSSRVTPRVGGQQDVNTRVYQVAVARDAGPFIVGDDGGDELLVVACPGDPSAVGRHLLVVEESFADQSLERVLVCLDNLPGNNPVRPPAGSA